MGILVFNYLNRADPRPGNLILPRGLTIWRIMRKTGRFIWQSVLCLGFLSGVWSAVGFSPQSVLIGVIADSADSLLHDPWIRFFFLLLPGILLVLSLYLAYKGGKVTGMVSVVVAYMGGLFLLEYPVISILLLAIAVMLGILATSKWRPG